MQRLFKDGFNLLFCLSQFRLYDEVFEEFRTSCFLQELILVCSKLNTAGLYYWSTCFMAGTLTLI